MTQSSAPRSGFFGLSRATKLMLLQEFTMNVSFFMIYPYLATYLSRDLGFPGWVVGFILGIRVFSQQGLTIIGGTISDRIGYKPVILAGLLLRTVGFALFGFATDFPLVLLAAVLSGLAGALFSPALRAYLAAEAGERRSDMYALAAVFAQAGIVIGPLVGVVLLGYSFQWVAITSALVFLLLALLQMTALPTYTANVVQGESIWQNWREVVANRGFVLFSLAMLPYLTLFNQIYLGFPLEIRRISGADYGTTIILVVSSVLSVSLQVPIATYCRKRFGIPRSISIGLGILTLSFVPPLIMSIVAPSADEPLPLLASLGLIAPVVIGAGMHGLGVILAHPFAQSLIPVLGKERITATYFGFYFMIGGVSATFGNTLIGAAFDAGRGANLESVPWIVSIALGCLSTAGVFALSRSKYLTPGPKAP